MEIILTTNIKKLGKIGDLVNVKDGYARNYLIPNKMALRKNKKNLEYYERIKSEIAEKEIKRLDEAKKLVNELKKISIVFSKEADEKDQLYGSISKKEIIEYLQNHDVKLKSDDIIIKDPIRAIGEYEIDVNPYIDVTEKIKIVVKKN